MKYILGLTFFVISFLSYAQPTWLSPTTREAEFPNDRFLTGFISESNTSNQEEDELIQKLIGFAKAQLADNISVQINSISTLNVHNVNAKTHEEFKKMSVSYSSATIAGLTTKSYYDTKKNIGYAFVFAKISEVATYYRNGIKANLDKLLSLEKSVLNASNNETKLKLLLEAQTLIKNIENDQVMMVTLTADYNDPTLFRNQILISKARVEEAISTIESSEHATLDDGVYYMAFTLASQFDHIATLRLVNFTYQDTPMSSEFSRKLNTMLERKLAEQGCQITNKPSDNSLLLKGTYWEEGSRIRISAIVRNQDNGLVKGSVDTWLNVDALGSTSIKPENYKQALISMKEFAANEIKGGDLVVDVFTNKGKDNLIFTEGEVLKLFVRANRECYIRFIYHLADGSKVLLLDNYYINQDNVNQVYELPYEFECAEPFGAETLQVNAQNVQFDPLNVKKEYGYDFILDDREEIIVNTRGFKKKEAISLKAEKRLIITTMTN